MTLATLLGMVGTAAAQPADPYADPKPAPDAPTAPPPSTAPRSDAPIADPALAEQVAGSLVIRAIDLYDARELRDAKQLAVEAVVTSPHGPSAERARALIHQINQQLGIPEEQPPAPLPPPARPAPQTPDSPDDGTKITKGPIDAPTAGHGRVAAQVHAGLYTALIGATIGSAFSDSNQAAGAIPVGLAAGAAGAVVLAPVLDRHLDEAQIRTVGSGTVWGGVIGGLFADLTTGVGIGSSGTTGRQVLVGASIGSTLGGLGGLALAKQHELTRGDVALVDTLAGIGTFGGFTIGMLMQPAQSEAYDLNAVLGAAGGIVAGLVAAPSTNTTPRRMVRVAEYAMAGGAVPFILLPVTGASSGAERVVGALSSIGLVGGAILGFRSTKDWDKGQDAAAGAHDAPPAIVGRASDGTWAVGTPGLEPLSVQLDNHQHGLGLTLMGGRF